MTEERALALIHKLNESGYNVTAVICPPNPSMVWPGVDNTKSMWRVDLAEMHTDKVDLRHLINVADELDLDVGTSQLLRGGISFSEPAPERPAAVHGPRRHPR